MTPTQLTKAFENLSLSAEAFDHRAHLAVAWTYLQDRPLPEAMIALRDGIKRFATHHGAPGKYHETMTFFLLTTLSARLSPESDFETFLAQNPDLQGEWKALLAAHYSPALLESYEAKAAFLLPDRLLPPEPKKAPAT